MGGLCQKPVVSECNPPCAGNDFCVFDVEDQQHVCRGGDYISDACSEKNLVKIDIRRNFAAQIALGLPVGFSKSYVDIQRTNDAGVTTVGLMGVDTSSNVAFVAWQHKGSNISNHAQLENLAVSHYRQIRQTSTGEPNRGPFTSWDGHSAWNVTFQVPDNPMSPIARVNDIADRLLGGRGTGRLTDSGDPASTQGPNQYVSAQYVLRENNNNTEVIVVMAVALHNLDGTEQYFGLKDVAGGAALARYFDRTVVQCETSTVFGGAVDFVFVVDDSGSMANAQHLLSVAGETMAKALDKALDWRVALVTSSYHRTTNGCGTYGNDPCNNANIIRGFTSNVQQFQAWLRRNSRCSSNVCTIGEAPEGFPPYSNWNPLSLPACGGTSAGANNGCWIGTSGSGAEGMLGAARKALVTMSCTDGAQYCLRSGADIVVVIISDTDDQTSGWSSSNSSSDANGGESNQEPRQNFINFFRGLPSTAIGHSDVPNVLNGRTVRVNAVYCPAGQACGDDRRVPAYSGSAYNGVTRIQAVVQATQGRLVDIGRRCSTSTITSCTDDGDPDGILNFIQNVVDDTIASAGVEVQKPFIGASLRVAIQNPAHPMPGGNCNKSNVRRSRDHGFDYDGMQRTISFFGDCLPPKEGSPVAISYRAWNAVNRLPCQDDILFDPNEIDYCKGRFVCDEPNDVCICPPAPKACGGCPEGTTCHANTCTCEENPILQ